VGNNNILKRDEKLRCQFGRETRGIAVLVNLATGKVVLVLS
jgi:hypothetical protein